MSGENGAEQPIEVTAVEEAPGAGAAVAPVPVTPALAVAPQGNATELVARLDAIKDAQAKAMVKDVDYGVIPGTDKPTLYKPGAEKLAALFQLDTQPQNEKRWEADGHLTVVSRVTIFHAPTGARLGAGEGICTTRERKYAYRNQNRKCPHCGEEAVIKGKKEYGGGWLCFKKKGGCNAKWPDGTKEIEGQEVGELDNPDLPDLWNTVDKMATKRALVAAVLIVTGASAVFTQDVEDMAEPVGQESTQQPPAKPKPKLPAEKVNVLGKAIGTLGLSYKDIGLMLGAIGADNITEESGDGLRVALEGLTEGQASALEARLEAVAQDQAATAPQGGGNDGE